MQFFLAVLLTKEEDAEKDVSALLEPHKGKKWTSWTIGGYWNGCLVNHNPYKEPENYEMCPSCNGTGDRPGWVKYIHRDTGEEINQTNHKSDPLVSFALAEMAFRQTNGGYGLLPKEHKECLILSRASTYPEYERIFTKKTYPGQSHENVKYINGCFGCLGTGLRLKEDEKLHPSNVISVAKVKWENLSIHYPYNIVTPDGQWYEVWENITEILVANKDKYVVTIDCKN